MSRSYFSAAKFRDWCVEEFGPRPPRSTVARRLGITRQHVERIWSGEQSPNLETYLRMTAQARLPIGTWLSHLMPTSEESGANGES